MIVARLLSRALQWPSLVLATFVGLALGEAPAATSLVITKALALAPNERVFAYSRVSPDGQYLAYASHVVAPTEGQPKLVQRVVNLAASKVVFSEAGIDGYFATDSRRLVFLSQAGGKSRVAIRNLAAATTTYDVAPSGLGDYFSWGTDGGCPNNC